MRLELDYDRLSNTGLQFDGDDLRLGLSLGLVSPPTAVALAKDAVAGGATDPSLVSAAEMRKDDVVGVRLALRAVDPDEADLYPPASVRLWTFLELKAAYELREQLPDPLGVVELIYAAFDYPPAVAPFVRYMPPTPGAQTGEAALFESWRSFLQVEGAELAGEGSRP